VIELKNGEEHAHARDIELHIFLFVVVSECCCCSLLLLILLLLLFIVVHLLRSFETLMVNQGVVSVVALGVASVVVHLRARLGSSESDERERCHSDDGIEAIVQFPSELEQQQRCVWQHHYRT
jgi:hypothetical protein